MRKNIYKKSFLYMRRTLELIFELFIHSIILEMQNVYFIFTRSIQMYLLRINNGGIRIPPTHMGAKFL